MVLHLGSPARLARALEQLLAWPGEPALLVRVPSGALRGRRREELDEAQLQRVLASEFGHNADMPFTARAELARRGGGPPAPRQMRLGV